MPEIHQLAKKFPEMSDLEFEGLKADIKENGLKEEIVLFEGKILDGRNRFKACVAVGKEPRYREFKGKRADAEKYSASANLMRRHLSKSQKAMVIAKMGLASKPSASRRPSDDGKDSIREAGKRYGVNHMTIYKAFYVLDNDPPLADKVIAGKVSVGKAEATIRNQQTNGKPQRVALRFDSVQDAVAFIQSVDLDSLDEKTSRAALRHLAKVGELLADHAAASVDA